MKNALILNNIDIQRFGDDLMIEGYIRKGDNELFGIVEEVGKVQEVIKATKSAKIVIDARKVLEDVMIGDSISTNGVC